MSLKKNYLKSKPVCKVTFKLPKEISQEAKKVALVGEFNDWTAKKAEMRGLKDGSFTKTIDLEVGQEYQFRYLIDEKIWENDREADKYVASGVSSEKNSVVVV
jgi:1,4-alpha-glucan branching enzyme